MEDWFILISLSLSLFSLFSLWNHDFQINTFFKFFKRERSSLRWSGSKFWLSLLISYVTLPCVVCRKPCSVSNLHSFKPGALPHGVVRILIQTFSIAYPVFTKCSINAGYDLVWIRRHGAQTKPKFCLCRNQNFIWNQENTCLDFSKE